MGEEIESGVVPIVNNNIDFSAVNDHLEEISNALTPSNKTIIRNCALTLYANTNFDNNVKSPVHIAKECIDRALIIANELKDRNLLVD